MSRSTREHWLGDTPADRLNGEQYNAEELAGAKRQVKELSREVDYLSGILGDATDCAKAVEFFMREANSDITGDTFATAFDGLKSAVRLLNVMLEGWDKLDEFEIEIPF